MPTHENITVQACLDSDRLDLGRVGTTPDRRLLCTPLAKQRVIIEWGYQKSLMRTFAARPIGLADIENLGPVGRLFVKAGNGTEATEILP